jgi:argininosuccinate synthase
MSWQLLTYHSVLDGRVRALRDLMSKQWSELVYNGMYFSPECAFLQRQCNLFDHPTGIQLTFS